MIKPQRSAVVGVDQFAGQEQLAGHAFADVAQQVRHHHRRDQAAPHFGVAELRLRHATARSQTVTSPAPPATAGPFTAAIVGLGSV